MFPLKKLAELSPRTRLRKIARILHQQELDLLAGKTPDPGYLSELAALCADAGAGVGGARAADAGAGAPGTGAAADNEGAAAGAAAGTETSPAHNTVTITVSAAALSSALGAVKSPKEIERRLNMLRNDILSFLGAEPSEWDLVEKETGVLDRSTLSTFPIAAYLEDVRSPFNVGSMFRTAEAFGAQRMLLSPRTPLPAHPRARKTARGAGEALPWRVCELSDLRGEPGIFALELGGTPLSMFRFPRSGIVLVGSEELGLSPEALEMADKSLGRVSIPLSGAKASLNVSVAFGILMSRWHEELSAKR